MVEWEQSLEEGVRESVSVLGSSFEFEEEERRYYKLILISNFFDESYNFVGTSTPSLNSALILGRCQALWGSQCWLLHIQSGQTIFRFPHPSQNTSSQFCQGKLILPPLSQDNPIMLCALSSVLRIPLLHRHPLIPHPIFRPLTPSITWDYTSYRLEQIYQRHPDRSTNKQLIMSRGLNIDRINSRYQGSAIGAPQPIGAIETIGGAGLGGATTAFRRSFVGAPVVSRPIANAQTVVRRSRAEVIPTSVVAPVVAPARQVLTQRREVVETVTPPATSYVEERVSVPPPPPIQRRRNRSVEVYRSRGFCDCCPWWLWLLFGLLFLLALLGLLLYAFRDSIFGRGSSVGQKEDRRDWSRRGEAQTRQGDTDGGRPEGPQTTGGADTGSRDINIRDDGSKLPLLGPAPPITAKATVNNRQTVTITNVTCRQGYFFHRNKCLSCPDGSYWNGNRCVKRVVDRNPQLTQGGGSGNGLHRAQDTAGIKVAKAWSVVQPSSMDLRADCLFKQISSQSNTASTTVATGSDAGNGETSTSTTSTTTASTGDRDKSTTTGSSQTSENGDNAGASETRRQQGPSGPSANDRGDGPQQPQDQPGSHRHLGRSM